MILMLATAEHIEAQNTELLGHPRVSHLYPMDVTNKHLYHEYFDHDDDPSLNPNQGKVVIHSWPVWYPDPSTGELRRIDTAISDTIDLKRLVPAYGNDSNLIRFLVNESGESLYSLGAHSLRLWMDEARCVAKSTKYDEIIERAVHPENIVVDNSTVIMSGVLRYTAIQYDVMPGKIKETLTVDMQPMTAGVSNVRYTWGYDTTLQPFLSGNEIAWCHDGATVFRCPSPKACDAIGRDLPCEYELHDSRLSVVFDPEVLENAAYPIMIDPAVTTDQGDAIYNRSVGDEDDETWKSCYAQFALPDLSGIMTWIDWAIFTVNVTTAAAPYSVDVYCDSVVDTGSWNESASGESLAALTFNGAIAGDSISATGSKVFDIAGSVAVGHGIRKIYSDDQSPGNASVKIALDPQSTEVNDIEKTAFTIGGTVGMPADGNIIMSPRTDATYYWRVEIGYSLASGTGSPGGMIAAIRTEIENLLDGGVPYPFTTWADYLASLDRFPIDDADFSYIESRRFYNFVDSEEWTLTSLLAKTDYGNTWVPVDRWQNPAIWMQIKQALEQLTYIREENEFQFEDTDDITVDRIHASNVFTDPLDSMATMQETGWDDAGTAITSVDETTAFLNFNQSTARDNPPWVRVITDTNIELTVYAKSYNGIGAFSNALIFYRQLYTGGGAGSHTVTDDDAVNYNWDPDETASTFDGIDFDSQSKTETWADAAYAASAPGVSITFSVSRPSDTPCATHPAYDSGENPITYYSGKTWYPHYFQINRQLEVSDGLTYG